MLQLHRTQLRNLFLLAFFISITAVTVWLFFSSKKMVQQKSVSTVTKADETLHFPEFKTTSGRPPQFVVLSFDGSKTLDMWRNTRDFAQRMKQEGKPLHFTYFISGVYFLAPQYAPVYHPPTFGPGNSAIGFSDSAQDVVERIKQMNGAIAEGHEIGSHANGHFAGGRWSKENWDQEFNEFEKLIFRWQENNHLENDASAEVLHLQPKDIIGFRSPLLSKDDAMFQSLADHHFQYDASSVTEIPELWPTKNSYGTWLIPLADIPMKGTSSRVISMDYNFYSRQTNARDWAKRGTPLWLSFRQQMFDSYMDYFNKNYQGDRAPVIIGHHFSTWNDGVYWQTMQDFAEEVCGKPDVYCVDFKELVGYLDTHKK